MQTFFFEVALILQDKKSVDSSMPDALRVSVSIFCTILVEKTGVAINILYKVVKFLPYDSN